MVSEMQIKSAYKGVLKYVLTEYLLHKHCVLVVPCVRTLMIYYQKIWFHEYLYHIHKKEGVALRYIENIKYINFIGLATPCVYHNCGEKKGFMLELCSINIIFYYQYYTTYCILFFHGHFTIFSC